MPFSDRPATCNSRTYIWRRQQSEKHSDSAQSLDSQPQCRPRKSMPMWKKSLAFSRWKNMPMRLLDCPAKVCFSIIATGFITHTIIGLNVEQRKRLTIGVELAAKPELLLFLDEPTSGLDSQTSWSIAMLIRKLSNAGVPILCTIHQPSAMLFQQFDRLLLLAKGGKTVYFGGIGENGSTLTSYFERNGSVPCGAKENPAEWMLKVIGAAPGAHTDHDWNEVWRNSAESAAVRNELDRLTNTRTNEQSSTSMETPSYYAAPTYQQMVSVTRRVFEQYWRSPSYIYAKLILCGGTVGNLEIELQRSQANIICRVSSSVSLFTRPNYPSQVFNTRCFPSSCFSSFSPFSSTRPCPTSLSSASNMKVASAHPGSIHGQCSSLPISSSSCPGTRWRLCWCSSPSIISSA